MQCLRVQRDIPCLHQLSGTLGFAHVSGQPQARHGVHPTWVAKGARCVSLEATSECFEAEHTLKKSMR